MERFATIEDARETMDYTDEDLTEVNDFITNKNYTMALNVLEHMTKNCEAAARLFPEMETEADAAAKKITPVMLRLIREAKEGRHASQE